MNESQYFLDSKECAQVALYMYRKYVEAMQPPVFAVLSFEEWLQKIIEQSQKLDELADRSSIDETE